MASTSGGSGRRGPRGSKAQIDAVRRTAEKAGKELDREQEESIGELAKALGQINEHESLGHLDSRLAFLERQVERLTARRDEADRGIQGELAVMRARIDDALEAVAATSQDQKETLAGQQKQFSQLILESEHRSSSVSEALRQELVSKVQDALTRLEKYEARLRGEMQAFEEGAIERARAVSESLAKSREELDQRLDEIVEEISGGVDGSSKELLTKIEKTAADLTTLIDEASGELNSQLDAKISQFEERLLESGAQLNESIEEFRANATQEVADALSRLNEMTEASENRLTDLEGSLTSKIDAEKREGEARFSEWVAEGKLETQKLKELIESSGQVVDEKTEAVKRELLMRLQSADEKATAAAIRLESFLAQVRKELTAGEEEWSQYVKETDETLADLSVRTEELLGRVSSSEAKVAQDRGSREALIQSIAGRVDHIEERIREAVEEVNAKHATKIEMLSSQLSGIAESEVNAEEKLGAVDYLKRRVAEMSEQLDEIMVKVNAIGRYMTKPQNAQKLGLPYLSPDVAERLGAIERAVAELASRPSGGSTSIPKEFPERLESLERAVSALAAGMVQVDKPKAPEPVQEKLEESPKETQQPASQKAQRPPARPGLAQTILPQKRRW